MGYIFQGLAIACILIPKVALTSFAIMNAPYLFPIPFVLEYLLIICYNKIMFGIAGGKLISLLTFFSPSLDKIERGVSFYSTLLYNIINIVLNIS